MTQQATVEQLLEGNRARIAVARSSACAHDCGSCAGCGAPNQVIHATAYDPIGVSQGDRVLVRSDNRSVLGAAALVYLLPIAGFFAGYAASASLGSIALRALITVGATALGLVPAVVLDRRRAIRFEITRRL